MILYFLRNVKEGNDSREKSIEEAKKERKKRKYGEPSKFKDFDLRFEVEHIFSPRCTNPKMEFHAEE